VPPPPTEPDEQEVELEVGNERWCVVVLGRSGGRGSAAVPLLLLGFRRTAGDSTDVAVEDRSDRSVEREALVVGRTLAALTPTELERALEDSREPPPQSTRIPSENRSRRGRGHGATGRKGP
jgi:hypothetical protein